MDNRFTATTLCVLALLTIAGCTRLPNVEKPATGSYDIPGGWVHELTLKDGTHCVVYDGYKSGGISCDWRAANVE